MGLEHKLTRSKPSLCRLVRLRAPDLFHGESGGPGLQFRRPLRVPGCAGTMVQGDQKTLTCNEFPARDRWELLCSLPALPLQGEGV